MFVVVLLVDFSEDSFLILDHFPFILHSINITNQIQLTYSENGNTYIQISKQLH